MKPCRRCVEGLAWLLVIGLGGWLRAVDLDSRPMHVDEAVHALRCADFLETNHMPYDRMEFHGPTLYLATWPSLVLAGHHRLKETNEADYRRIPLIAGMLLILLPFLMRDLLGRRGALCAGLLVSLSPMMVYYSGYYIHEALFVLIGSSAACCLSRYARCGHPGWGLAAGIASGLLIATKETWLIVVAAAALTGLIHIACMPRSAMKPFAWGRAAKAVTYVLLPAVLTLMVTYSPNLQKPFRFLEAFQGLPAYLERAGGIGSAGAHRQGFDYYARLLGWWHIAPGPVWTEGLVLAGWGIGLWTVLQHAGNCDMGRHSLLIVFSLMLCVVYSLIPYKTPWNVLGAWYAVILVAGFSFVALDQQLSPGCARWIARSVFCVLVLHLLWQAHRTPRRYASDPRNPWVYAHTVPDLLLLAQRIQGIAGPKLSGAPPTLRVLSADYWPLPWYLRGMAHVGYDGAITSAALSGDLLLVRAEDEEALSRQLAVTGRHPDEYIREYFGLRPGILLQLWTQRTWWDQYLLERSVR